jgi:hypothetical protein
MDSFKNIQVHNGKVGVINHDDYQAAFNPYYDEDVPKIANDLKHCIQDFLDAKVYDPEGIVLTESLVIYILDNVDPKFFEGLTFIDIIEDEDLSNCLDCETIPYYGLYEISFSAYEFKPKPMKLNINWQALSEVDFDKAFGPSAEDQLIAAAKKEVLKATGIPPKYLQ